MKLHLDPFEKIKSGEKTFEFRLNDEKRKLLNVGDRIVFHKLPDLVDTLEVEVVSLISSPSFADLFDRIASRIEPQTKDAFVQGKRRYYSEEEERGHGVLAIEIKRV